MRGVGHEHARVVSMSTSGPSLIIRSIRSTPLLMFATTGATAAAAAAAVMQPCYRPGKLLTDTTVLFAIAYQRTQLCGSQETNDSTVY